VLELLDDGDMDDLGQLMQHLCSYTVQMMGMGG
jgi:hypothetical protein